MSPLTLDAGTAPPGVACPGCGWMESAQAFECRSCGNALPSSRGPVFAAAPAPLGETSATPAPALPAEINNIFPPIPYGLSPHPSRAQPTRIARPPAATSRFPSLKKTSLVLGLTVLAGWHWLSLRPVTQPPGMMIPEEPVQGGVPAGKIPWIVKDARIVPLASYRIKARVLHTERYRFERMADLSPLDLGVGWRVMSDETWASASEFSNSNRYLSWHYKDPAFPGEASICISNMHLLPANDRVKDRLLALRKGELIQLNGYLVEVQRPGMNPWTSSLSRFDTGDGACEIMWVESALPIKATPVPAKS